MNGTINKETIRLLALDLDDTLLSEELTISRLNREAVEAAEEAGVTVILASGRTLFSMRDYGRQLGMWGREGFMIANNGATVLSTKDGTTILEKPLEPAVALEAWEVVQEFGLTMQYYGDGEIFTSGPNPYTEKDCSLTGQHWQLVEPFASYLTVPRTKFVIPGDPEILPRAEAEMKRRIGDRANIFISKPYFLEVLRKDADKGTALEYVAQALSLGASQTMAVGDSMNDFGMISWAGTGVAVANAKTQIREAADLVTQRTHQESAVAEAIERCIPGLFTIGRER